MNKITKGAIAGAAGIALLLGGAGTFALWNDSATINASSVSSGTLTIAAGSAGTWANVTSGTPVSIPSISAFKIVPGHKLTFTQTVNIVATGNDLKANLTFDPTTITGTLKPYITSTLTATAVPSAALTAGGANTYVVSPAVGTIAVTVVVTVELPSTTTGLSGQASTLDLSALQLTLTQIAIP